MGLFNKSNQPQRRQIRTMHKERPNENGDLQYKAKSKLIGAAVLAALGAVILPFIFSSEEPINQVTTPGQAPLVAPGAQAEAGASGTIAISAAPGVSVQSTEQGAAVATTEATPPATEAETSVQGTIDTADLTTSTEIPQSIANAVGESQAEVPVATQAPKTTPTQTAPVPSKPEPTKQVAQKPATQVPATTIVPTPTQSVAASTQTKPAVEVAKPTKPTGELKSVAPRQEIVQSTPEPVTKPQAPKVEETPKRTVTTPPKEEPQRTVATKPETKGETKSESKTDAKTDSKSEPKATAKVDNVKRTDDGSAARALLEGKKVASTSATSGSANSSFPKPQSSASTAKQRLTVQVGSFTSMDDARAQRDRLSSSGVSNVFVQNAVVNGRQTYRLRVGPFTNQESAQAALTRLRGLGHNGFITGN